MQYVMTPYARKMPPYAYMEKVFSKDELDRLQNIAREGRMDALVGGADHKVPEIRRSKLNWIHNEPATRWIYDRLAENAAKLNADFYGFELVGFGEALQFTHYGSDDAGMYGWHQDFNSGISRKLSVVVQLSDPSEYEGGNLQIAEGKDPVTVTKERGLMVVFPSWQLHQVTPVTSGSRQTLVAWISGAPFK
jgi:PKHD-type hydroxylase